MTADKTTEDRLESVEKVNALLIHHLFNVHMPGFDITPIVLADIESALKYDEDSSPAPTTQETK